MERKSVSPLALVAYISSDPRDKFRPSVIKSVNPVQNHILDFLFIDESFLYISFVTGIENHALVKWLLSGYIWQCILGNLVTDTTPYMFQTNLATDVDSFHRFRCRFLHRGFGVLSKAH